MTFPIQAILVPQGAEYQAICRGLSHIIPTPLVVPIPIGTEPLIRHLNKLQQPGHFSNHQQLQFLLMGLGGSLTHCYSVGDIVLYQACAYTNAAPGQLHLCDPTLTTLLQEKLKQRASLVKALTSDHLIWSADEKRHLGQIYSADGYSTASQTAWALIGLMAAGEATGMVASEVIERGVSYLLETQHSDGIWDEAEFTGTGFPGHFYWKYHLYQ